MVSTRVPSESKISPRISGSRVKVFRFWIELYVIGPLFLAFGAEKGGAPSDDNALNFCATVGTGCTGPVVNLEIVLKFTPPVNRIQASAFMHNPGVQGLPDGVV